METECHQCGYEWNYNGSKTRSATCPDCKRSTPLTDEQADTDSTGDPSGEDRNEDGSSQQDSSSTGSSPSQPTTVTHPLTLEETSVDDALAGMVEHFYDELNDTNNRIDDVEQKLSQHREMIIELTEAVEALASHQHDLAEGQPTDGQTVTLTTDLRDEE